jgi:hypothetical protein
VTLPAYQSDPDDASAQINLIGMPWLKIGEEPSAAPIGGSASVLPNLLRHSA